ncbi:MAG: hypothetical protein ACT4N8_00355 [Sphingosinicella sp.]|uniref:hypothetical protein n=1 Tax=Sphingosinicella sp. TaxID=1917971 RepID=UPI004037D82F
MSILLALLAAAQTGTPYTADGAEPFWSLEMANGRMIHRYDGREIDVPAPRARRIGAGRRYTTGRLVVTIRPERCEDESEQVRADRVDVIADGIAFSGCGGRVLRAPPE